MTDIDSIRQGLADVSVTANSLANTVGDAIDAVNGNLNAANNAINSLNNKLDSLPLDVDPEVLLRQKEAEILKKQAEIEELVLRKKEELLGITKEDILAMAIPKIPSLPKLPVLDPKILAQYALAEARKAAAELKRKKTSLNVKRAAVVLKYPIKPKRNLRLPQIPQIPTPNVPNLDVPSIEVPEIPKVPNIKSIKPPPIKLPKLLS